jgi:circadian clock protein KaiC
MAEPVAFLSMDLIIYTSLISTMVMNMKRLSTGIKGLDKLLGGGIPEGQNILISGSPGTGKSTVGIQFLDEGMKKGERGEYVTVEESAKKISTQAESYNRWSNPPGITSGKEIKYDIGSKKPSSPEDMIKLLADQQEKKKTKRLVLDSLNALLTGDQIRDRKLLKLLFDEFDRLNLTTMIISEMPSESAYLSRDTISEYMADGVVLLKAIVVGDGMERSVEVRKLRNTKIIGGSCKVDFNKNGLVVEA